MLRFEPATLDGVKSRLLEVSSGLDHAGTGADAAGCLVSAGAGQFLGSMDDCVQKFVDSWRLYLGAVSDDCSIVGMSVGQAKFDLMAVDAASCVPIFAWAQPISAPQA